MVREMFIVFRIVVCLFTVVLMQGCIAEDLSRCAPKNNVDILFTNAALTKSISFVDLGIFDERGRCLEIIHLNRYRLNSFKGVHLGLCPGKYKIRGWANAGARTTLVGFTPDSDLTSVNLFHPNTGTLKDIDENDPVYFFSLDIDVPSATLQTFPVVLRAAHVLFRVHVAGLIKQYPVDTEALPRLRLRNVRGGYNSEMSKVGRFVNYNPPRGTSVNQLFLSSLTEFRTLRFSEDEPLSLEVLNDTGGRESILFQLNVHQFMKDNNLSIAEDDLTVIPIYIRFVNAQIVIQVNPWDESTTIEPDMNP